MEKCIYKHHDTWPVTAITVVIASTFPLYFGVNAYILVFSFSHYLLLEVLICNSILQLYYYTVILYSI